ncbi:ATP-dependent DNA helicase [Brevibacterium sp. 50QC2O2]|uniref:ATP-dependent DNA helicase n=1 Tax=Brevibacterium TaxID=1696 RepID=UPI00211CDB1D|nr:ATP-dependent DNA helicase [Brevibacterium sp. 91QC2O2]MCQ9385006.1 ATP-dependent DNA helicase [Brevibacterium sp. 68QC2CO]MCQ9387946.1 ATP-dependent DNA helicase [Brevibacterium sp. 50QC2O2]
MADVAELLGLAVGALGGTPRAGQQTMAEAVASALDTETHLLVQAGTGTGKSLGYLVPAVEYSMRTGSRVVVSTATLALQGQIIDRDLPRLVKATKAEFGRKPVAAVLKGRRNYVCKHKLDGGYPEDDAGMLFDLGADAAAQSGNTRMSRLEEEVARVRSWERTTDTGDRDDLTPGVSDKTWQQVSVNAADCLGSKCPLYDECYAEMAKLKAAGADVVVTNHALLAIDAFGQNKVLPEHGAVIIDEAHELRDRVTNALTGSLTVPMVQSAVASAKRHSTVPEALIGRLDSAANGFERALAESETGLLLRKPESLMSVVAAVRDEARTLVSEMGGDKERSDDDADAGKKMAKARVQEVFELAERMALDADNDVLWVARNQFRETETTSLVTAPLSVAGTMRSGLFAESTVVATSATLALGGKFEAVAASLGLVGPDAPRYDAIDVGSPFDYPKQGILYVAGHLPKPGRSGLGDEATSELVELVAAAGGGALGLFSSKLAATQAAEALRAHTDLPILLQGEETLGQLVKRFAAEDETCLMGTLSLWQGVDVPGQACRLVVIDRIPFPRPDDPLAKARTAQAQHNGANGFMAVSATSAALKLAQGVGRLIRTVDDRGVVAILDSRMRTARYGGFLLQSLPPLWRTDDYATVRGALQRLGSMPAAAD